MKNAIPIPFILHKFYGLAYNSELNAGVLLIDKPVNQSMTRNHSKSIRDEQAERTKKAILTAALVEFSSRGFDGASTVAIMKAADVNQSLLYYYFKNKMGIYEAAIRDAIETYVEQSNAVFMASTSPGDRLIRAAMVHFDRYITDHQAQSLLQQELLRFWSGGREFASLLVQELFRPWLAKMEQTVREGIGSGELREVSWRQVVVSILGANAYYFLNSPLIGLAFKFDPFSQPELEAQRRETALFLGVTMFTDPVHGREIASSVVASLPCPRYEAIQAWGEVH
jgi:TetR/AcrR family transcriptional regulator